MYLSTTRAAADRPQRTRAAVPVSGTVIGLGLVSMFTDISAEMITAVLPLYLVYSVGIGYAALGAIDGLYTAATSLLRLAGGYLADRLGRPKTVAAAGYGLSALTKLGFPLAGASLTGIGLVIAADRAGKGIRTAPRDAMITQATPAAGLGTAFGVHRTLDTAGALLGPIVAFALLSGVGTGYPGVFAASFALAVVGVLILLFFVSAPATPKPGRAPRAGLGPLIQPRLRRTTLAAALLGVCTAGDLFLFLALQQRAGLPTAVLPLLPLGTALTFLAAATPVGRLADRAGRWRIFLAGHGLLLLAYLLLAAAPGWPAALVALLCHGLFYAATDGVLMAHAAPLIPAAQRATGLAIVQTAQSLARAAGAVLFGIVAAATQMWPTFLIFAAALLAGIALAAWLGRREHA